LSIRPITGTGRRGRIAAVAAAALLIALLDGLLCARAGLGRTGSWSFPIDDAYIYANYVRGAETSGLFQYNPGEQSGGVTGAGWMLLLLVAHPLTGLLGDAPAGLAPAAAQAAMPATALAAGRLYLAAYGWGALLLAGAALACGWLAWEIARALPPPAAWTAALLAGGALLADQNVVWGAYSGLELSLSLLLIALAPATLLHEVRAGGPVWSQPLRWSLPAVALLPWARPELAVAGAAAVLWLAWGAARGRRSWRTVAAYGAAVVAGLAALAAFYWWGTGYPLPSSFYAKVGGARLDTLTAALQEWVLAGAWQPFALLGAAALGTGLLYWASRRAAPAPSRDPAPAGLPALCALAYFVAMLVTLRWFGQEDRYIVPIHALTLPLAAGGIAVLAARLPAFRTPAAGRIWLAGAAAVALLALGVHIATLRVWAASDYALFIQNIEDAHVAPALWLAAHAAPGAVVAAEPIGAVRLFSGHPTVDIVGLTTPAQLGHYQDWPATHALLRARGAQYLLFYPRWWPTSNQPLPWAHEVQRFPVPDNRIAGDSLIAVYRLD
jgi:hypothetical protein